MSSLSERGERSRTNVIGMRGEEGGRQGERWLAFGGLNCWKRAGRFDVSASGGSYRCSTAALTAFFSRLSRCFFEKLPSRRSIRVTTLQRYNDPGTFIAQPHPRGSATSENATARLWLSSYLSAFPFTISFPGDGRADFAGAERSRFPGRRSRGKHGYPGLSLPETAGYPTWAARCFARKRAFMRAVSVTLNTMEYLFASAPPLRRMRNSDYGDPALYCRAPYRHRRVSRQSCGFLEEIGSENPDTGVDTGAGTDGGEREREKGRGRGRGGKRTDI